MTCISFFQWLCLIPWRLFHVRTSLFGIMNQYDPTHDLKINIGHYDLYFTVQWFCLISWRLFDVCTSYFQSMNQSVRPDVWPRNKCRSLWPIFNGPVIMPYILKTITCMNIIIWDYESVWHDASPQNRTPWPIFHGPVILCYILKTIWCMNIILWDYGSVWPDVWPQNKCMSLYLHFMVRWFFLISQRLFDGWVSYF